MPAWHSMVIKSFVGVFGLLSLTSVLYCVLSRLLGRGRCGTVFRAAMVIGGLLMALFTVLVTLVTAGLYAIGPALYILIVVIPVIFALLIIFVFVTHPILAAVMLAEEGDVIGSLAWSWEVFKKEWKSVILAQLKILILIGLSLWALLTLILTATQLNIQLNPIPLTLGDLADALLRDCLVNALIARELIELLEPIKHKGYR